MLGKGKRGGFADLDLPHIVWSRDFPTLEAITGYPRKAQLPVPPGPPEHPENRLINLQTCTVKAIAGQQNVGHIEFHVQSALQSPNSGQAVEVFVNHIDVLAQYRKMGLRVALLASVERLALQLGAVCVRSNVAAEDSEHKFWLKVFNSDTNPFGHEAQHESTMSGKTFVPMVVSAVLTRLQKMILL